MEVVVRVTRLTFSLALLFLLKKAGIWTVDCCCWCPSNRGNGKIQCGDHVEDERDAVVGCHGNCCDGGRDGTSSTTKILRVVVAMVTGFLKRRLRSTPLPVLIVTSWGDTAWRRCWLSRQRQWRGIGEKAALVRALLECFFVCVELLHYHLYRIGFMHDSSKRLRAFFPGAWTLFVNWSEC